MAWGFYCQKHAEKQRQKYHTKAECEAHRKHIPEYSTCKPDYRVFIAKNDELF